METSRYKRGIALLITVIAIIGISFALTDKNNLEDEKDNSLLSINEASEILNTSSLVVAFDADVEVVELTADGEHIAFFEDRMDADKALSDLKAIYGGESNSPKKVSFVEDVKIEEKKISMYDFDQFIDAETALQLMMTGSTETKIHVVEEGDTIYGIAMEHDLREDDIYAANPDMSEDKYLQIGQEVKLLVSKPLLNVQVIESTTLLEDVSYGVIKEEDDTIYEGDNKVLTEGELGKQKVKVDIISINGQEMSRDILKKEILKEAKDQVLAVGTKVRPKQGPTGDFIRPASGYIITSGFGERRSYNHYHKGIDMAMSVGSAVWAADGGRVIHAGWQGSFGKLVIIDHGNGMQTYYAHLNSINVHEGEVVGQGDRIGNSGNTGRSTGPHLHFEIRVGGTPVNPTRYLSF